MLLCPHVAGKMRAFLLSWGKAVSPLRVPSLPASWLQRHSRLTGSLTTASPVLDVALLSSKNQITSSKARVLHPGVERRYFSLRLLGIPIWMQWDTEHWILKDFAMGSGMMLWPSHCNGQRRKKLGSPLEVILLSRLAAAELTASLKWMLSKPLKQDEVLSGCPPAQLVSGHLPWVGWTQVLKDCSNCLSDFLPLCQKVCSKSPILLLHEAVLQTSGNLGSGHTDYP